MELEQYLERDIITFLDSRITKKEKNSIDREEEYGLYLTKDYVKDLTYALDNDELTKAKKLFDELKVHYSQMPKTSVERKKIYSLLEKMYGKIQNYVKIKEGRIEVIKQGESEIQKERGGTDSSDSQKFPAQKNSVNPVADVLVEKPTTTKGSGKTVGGMWKEPAEGQSKTKNIVEANIIGKSTKSVKGGKYYEEKNEERTDQQLPDDIRIPNVFMKTKDEMAKDTDTDPWEISHRSTHHHEYPKGSDIMDQELEELMGEVIGKTTERFERIKSNIKEQVLAEVKRKLDEENEMQDKRIRELKSEITHEAITQIDKYIAAERKDDDRISGRPIVVGNYNIEGQEATIRPIGYAENSDIVRIDKRVMHQAKGKDMHKKIHPTSRDHMPENISSTTGDITIKKSPSEEKSQKKISGNRQADKEIQQLYEEAIYTMFQNNYSEARRMFEKILEARPDNRAAKIRLHECLEAIDNA
jgi:TolA-binding protein